MDAQALKAHVEAARRATLDVAGYSFTVRLPSRFDLQMEYVQQRGKGHDHMTAAMYCTRNLVTRSLVGWANVRLSDFGADAADPVPFDASLVEEFFLNRPGVAEGLDAAFDAAIAEREARLKAAEKN
jgi:hypothetical protein